ncbi:MAG: SCO family protein [Alphaproteobacteria bacterium]|nr:SCO family protein [Alphaproteobacteria bacterium]
MKLLLALAIVLLPLSAANAGLTPDQLSKVAIRTPVGAALPEGVRFKTMGGASTTIGAVLAGKPALVVFADYTCHMLCGPVLAMASGALHASGLTPDKDFRFVVIGIDPKDTPADARKMEDREVGDPALRHDAVFLMGNKHATAAATEAVGYSYVYDAEHDQYAHPTAAFAVTPTGKVSQVLTSVGIEPESVRLALVKASKGSVGNLGDRIRLLCYGFDPATGLYSASVMLWLRIGGLATVLVLGGGLAWFALRRRRNDEGNATP